ncbi:hypothetical protein [Rubrolithibacter danxiaensis]|uniref:hypothetical protein n=1 Tax=Rubrolithibacter danxiaensis TaxID=3390805 RepID=UPI003BF78E60
MKLQLFLFLLLIGTYKTYGQGCVAIRSTGNVCTMDHTMGEHDSISRKWSLNANNRYYKSFRHFSGSEEQKQRVEQGTEVINHAYTLDLSLTRSLSSRWSLSLDVPVIGNTRSSLYEHGGAARHNTGSFGIGDIRISAYRWLLNPAKKANIQAGLGIKLPTGRYKVKDQFYTVNDTKIMGPVDQSIQLGDGGTGITAEINTFYTVSNKVNLYGNFYYLANPRERNGVSTARGGTPSATAIAYTTDVMSVPDQYMIRVGTNYSINKFTISAGLRDECLPAHDLIGGNRGFRRPGYILSAEPGVVYKFRNVNTYIYAPIALVRNRTQSYPDEIRSNMTGTKYIGDAAFADYSISIGTTFNF